MPAQKQQELSAAGITDWQAGQNRGQGPAIATLGNAAGVPMPDDTATMVYDDGMVTALPSVFGQIYGNKFSQGVGGVPLSTITLNSFSFYFLEDSPTDTGLFFQPGHPVGPTSFFARASTNVGGLINSGSSFTTPVLNVVPQTALGTTGVFSNTFFLGGWCLNGVTTFPVDNETLVLATNGPRLQGYTASSAASATIAYFAQPFNAILRANVTSPNAVPVELMAVSAE
jgi:hypothetical protein